MMKLRSLVTGLALTVLTPTLAYADDTVFLPDAPAPLPNEPDVGKAVSPMRKGQLAPFTGVLLSPAALATIIVELQSFDARVKIETDKVRADEVAACDHRVAQVTNKLSTERDIALVQVESRNKEIAILNDIIKKQEEDMPNLPLWVGVGSGLGAVIGVGFTLLTVYVSNQVIAN